MNNSLINEKLNALSKSKFRSSKHLTKKEILYTKEKGLDTIKKHAYDFINARLKPAIIKNDGKQTPWHGHPVFVSEHATATCCRSCLYKWHHIPKNRELTKEEVDFIVSLIMAWIEKEINNTNNSF